MPVVIDSDDNAKKKFQSDDKISEEQLTTATRWYITEFLWAVKKNRSHISHHNECESFHVFLFEIESITNFFLCVMRERGTRVKNTSKFQFESRSSKWYVVVVFECLSMITEMSHVFLYVSSFFFSFFFHVDYWFNFSFNRSSTSTQKHTEKNSWNYFIEDNVGDKELMLRYKPNKIEMIW